ncbi:MAG TPA: hypothetical protein PK819_02530 [Thermomicrobiales bacterium]|nr:hypothetical protein [Thermomicrobiales bacterium]
MENDAAHHPELSAVSEAGYVLHVSDRTTAAMQLAAHYTAESMRLSEATDPRARLAEQLSYFDLAFRSIMSSTARTMVRNGASSGSSELNGDGRLRNVTSEFA